MSVRTMTHQVNDELYLETLRYIINRKYLVSVQLALSNSWNMRHPKPSVRLNNEFVKPFFAIF